MDSDRSALGRIQDRLYEPPDGRPLCSTCGDREEQSMKWHRERCDCACHWSACDLARAILDGELLRGEIQSIATETCCQDLCQACGVPQR